VASLYNRFHAQGQHTESSNNGLFLRITGPIYKKEYYPEYQRRYRTLYGGKIRDIDSTIQEIPLETCGAYDAWFLTVNSDVIKICQHGFWSSKCEKLPGHHWTTAWTPVGNQDISDKCPKTVSVRLDRENSYYMSKVNSNDFTGLKLMVNMTKLDNHETPRGNHITRSQKLLEEPVQQCGNNEDVTILKINPKQRNVCQFHFRNAITGDGDRYFLDNCESKIQLCSSEDCCPLSNGEANINVIFRIEGSETSNSQCPKVILQMDSEGLEWNDWNTDGSTFYVGY